MAEYLPNGQDLINDARENARQARRSVYWKTFDEYRKSISYTIGRSRVETLYKRGNAYDVAAAQGWTEGAR